MAITARPASFPKTPITTLPIPGQTPDAGSAGDAGEEAEPEIQALEAEGGGGLGIAVGIAAVVLILANQ